MLLTTVAPQLSDVEQVALVDRHGAAERRVVCPGVAGEVDAPDRISRSLRDARAQFQPFARAGGLHVGSEIGVALCLGILPRLEQTRAQLVHRGGAGKAHFARRNWRLTSRRSRSD